MALVPSPIVPAPESLRRRYGLFDAASGPLDLPSHGEGGGVRYVPDTCGTAYAYPINCEEDPPVKPLDPDNDEVSTGVFAVLSTLECSAVGYPLNEYRTKVRRRLEASEQAAVESALWTGLDFEGGDLEILALNGPDTEDIDPGYDGTIQSVLGALERYAYTEQGYGSAAYIHAPVEVAAYAANAGLVIGDGPRKVTPMGSVWSFGAYPGGNIIVTGQTTVWRSDVQTYDAFETATNLRLMIAERGYAVSFDCFAGRAEFDPLGVTSP